MAVTQIRGSTQIMAATITADRFVASLNLPTSQLQDGALFVKKDGSVTFTADQSLGGFKITNLGDAVSSQDAVNLRTAQALINGIAIKNSRGVSTSNQALTGLPTVDGITYTAGQYILLTAQSTASQNGLWAVAAGSWTRPTEWAAASTQQSTLFFVQEGTTYHDTKWIAITDSITVDTTSVTVSQDLSGIVYTNGNGLSLVGSTFAVKNGNGIAFDGSQNITVTPDSNGLLTVGAGGVRITAAASPAQVIVSNGSNNPAWVTPSGDVSVTAAGAMNINVTSGSGFLNYSKIVANETPTGSLPGTSFSVAAAPYGLQLFLNGQLLESGAGNDYTISGTAITTLFTVSSGDKLRAYYYN